MNKKVALITGITGQDGSYLAELLLEKNYIVHGLRRRSSQHSTGNIDHLLDNKDLKLYYGDVTDGTRMTELIYEIAPYEIYHLAAQSHVGISFDNPVYTAQVNAIGTINILEAIRMFPTSSVMKFYQASTSELYGNAYHSMDNALDENSPFNPTSPYAIAKRYAFDMVKHYRDTYGMYACNGILFNHESPRRGDNFVTRKITKAVAAIAAGEQDCLYLGNLDAQRDWGHARDYVEGMWLMLQQDKPDDYVLATGETHTVRQFVQSAFSAAGIQIGWNLFDEETQLFGASNLSTGQPVVAIDKKHYRPSDVNYLCGDATKAKEILGWEPKTTFKELVKEMVYSDSGKSYEDVLRHERVHDELLNSERFIKFVDNVTKRLKT